MNCQRPDSEVGRRERFKRQRAYVAPPRPLGIFVYMSETGRPPPARSHGREECGDWGRVDRRDRTSGTWFWVRAADELGQTDHEGRLF